MGNSLEIKKKKSAVKANKDFDFCQVTQKNEFLIPCSIIKGEDEINYTFALGESLKLKVLKEYPISFKYQLLINIVLLKPIADKLSFSLHPENLYFNINMMPKILMRDVYKESKFDEEDFIKAYKSLIGCLLHDKYEFEDYEQGGEKLLTKSKFTTSFHDLHSVEDINKTLVKEFKEYEEENRAKNVEIDKKKFKNLIYFRRIGVVIMLVLAFLCGYFAFFVIPENTKVIRGNEAFTKQDYISTMEALSDITLDHMSANTKFIYAISYVKTDALSEEQKNNILASITISSNTKVLDYWIYLSRKEFDQSIDFAKQLGNKEYLLYAYMKQKTYIETNGELSGSEREEILKQIESSIDSLLKEGVKNPNQDSSEAVKEGK